MKLSEIRPNPENPRVIKDDADNVLGDLFEIGEHRNATAWSSTPKYCQVTIDRMIKLDPEIEVKKVSGSLLETETKQ